MEKKALQSLVRIMTISVSGWQLFSYLMHTISGEYEKAQSRLAVGVILFALWGIMQHLRKD